VTFTTLELFASGFGFATLAFCARFRAASFLGNLDKPLVTGEIAAGSLWLTALALCTFSLSTGLLGSFDEPIATFKVGAAGLRLAALASCALGVSTGLLGSFDEAIATIKVGTAGLFDFRQLSSGRRQRSRIRNNVNRLTALALCTFSLSTELLGSFCEAIATIEVGTAGLFSAAFALLTLVVAARTERRPQETSRTLVQVARCLLFAAFLIRTTGVITRSTLNLDKTSSTLVRLAGCLLVATSVLRALQGIAATC